MRVPPIRPQEDPRILSLYDAHVLKLLVTLGLLILATSLEASGEAIIQVGLKTQTVPVRACLMLSWWALPLEAIQRLTDPPPVAGGTALPKLAGACTCPRPPCPWR